MHTELLKIGESQQCLSRFIIGNRQHRLIEALNNHRGTMHESISAIWYI
jgi:hypothetical protein